jgi:hypothetical protein
MKGFSVVAAIVVAAFGLFEYASASFGAPKILPHEMRCMGCRYITSEVDKWIKVWL